VYTMREMNQADRVRLLVQILEAALQDLPTEAQRAYCYLFARVAADMGDFRIVNDEMPEGSMRLVLRDPGTGRLFIAERPAEWTRDDEERYVAEMRSKLLG
jgi:hypothetical protein